MPVRICNTRCSSLRSVAGALAILSVIMFSGVKAVPCGWETTLGFYNLSCDALFNIESPWPSIEAALHAEMEWYAASPPVQPHGYPTWMYSTFVDGNYSIIMPEGLQIIGAMQDSMGILSLLKYWAFKGAALNDTSLLLAIQLGDYLITQTLTPPVGVYANITRSSGWSYQWPQTNASQHDVDYGQNTTEPDKAGISGYACYLLYNATGQTRFLSQAVHTANVLAATQALGNATNAPWPFRVDSVSGEGVNGIRNGNMAYIMRLYLVLIRAGYAAFKMPATLLWSWITAYQIPSPPTANASLFVNFFEDKTQPDNRNSWSVLELARLLIDERESLDAHWMNYTDSLFAFALSTFTTYYPAGNVTTVFEQDFDTKSWGGANSKLAGVAAKYACAGGPAYYKQMALNNAVWMTYFIDVDGCPSAEAYGINQTISRGGWQEDAHTDVVHNLVDALNAFNGVC